MPNSLKRQHRPHLCKTVNILSRACLAPLFFLLLFYAPSRAIASANAPHNNVPVFHVNAGFNTRYHDGNWIPIQAALNNDGPDFNGFVSVNVPSPSSGAYSSHPATQYQSPITLPNASQKQITLYVPFYLGASRTSQNITVDLLDASKHVVSTQVTTLRTLGNNDVFIGILSDQSTGFGPLNAVASPNQSGNIVTEQLDASTLPDQAAALKNFNLLIFDNFTTSTLTQHQLDALQSWVKQGGALLLVGGPEWRRTLGSLPDDLLPVSVTGTQTLPANTPLLPIGGPLKGGQRGGGKNEAVQAPVIASTAKASKQSSIILSAGAQPLLVQEPVGQGMSCYLAFDPTLEPLVSWSGTTTLWKGLLLRTVGEQLLARTDLSNAQGFATANVNADISNLLQALLPNTFPSMWLLLGLLLSYILVLGPVRLLIVRQLKNRDWSWRIALISILVFSLFSYGIALQQKGLSISIDSISVMQFSQPVASDAKSTTTSTAHTTTFMGVFVPNQGDFQVHLPGNGLAQPADDQGRYTRVAEQSQPTVITLAGSSTDITLQAVDIWTLRAISSEYDHQVQGGISSHLTLQNGALQGTVTNMLPYTLNDVSVLGSTSFIPLGSLLPQQTKRVEVQMNVPSTSSISFADQLAQSKQLSAPYNPYYGGSPPQNEVQRHIAILSTLSGEGPGCGNGPCYIVKTPLNNGSYFSGGPNAGMQRDPLLLPDTPATLIGWADQAPAEVSNATINGNHSSAIQETFVQAPLSVNVIGAFTLPASFTNGQLTDIQSAGNNVQALVPSVYSLATGSMTFEFTLPAYAQIHPTRLTIDEPSTVAQNIGDLVRQIPGTISDVNKAQVALYNWQTQAWDTTTISQYRIVTQDTHSYVGPGGRVLVQFANQDTSLGTILLGKPSLELGGTV